jgi:hypothetical protein
MNWSSHWRILACVALLEAGLWWAAACLMRRWLREGGR